ncbi:MAG: hypothetical protein PVG49_16355 [Desulfobacteraceae bacterium]|jgi:DNA-binding NtrC family response regulator
MAWLLVIDEDQDEAAFIERIARKQGYRTTSLSHERFLDVVLEESSPQWVVVSAGKHGELAGQRLDTLEREGVNPGRVLLITGAQQAARLGKEHALRFGSVLVRPLGLEPLERQIGRASSVSGESRNG